MALPQPLPGSALVVRLSGKVDEDMLGRFLDQIDQDGRDDAPIVLELSTTGGDADVGRRIALDVRLLRRQGRDCWFFGKSTVYSAGVTIMAAFPPERRVVSSDCSLLIHERRLEKEVKLNGALRANIVILKDLMAQLEHGQVLERDGFEELVAGTRLTMDDLMSRVEDANWYLRADEAIRLGLVTAAV